MFESRWPCLPLSRRKAQDAEAAQGTAPSAPVMEPPARQQTAIRLCPTCGDPLGSTDRRRLYCSDACKRQRNGVDIKPDAAPPRAQDYTADALELPRLPWDI